MHMQMSLSICLVIPCEIKCVFLHSTIQRDNGFISLLVIHTVLQSTMVYLAVLRKTPLNTTLTYTFYSNCMVILSQF